jgi:hypothetical protein
MAVGLEMLEGTPRPVGENQAEKREHRTEVTEVTEKVGGRTENARGDTEACGRETWRKKETSLTARGRPLKRANPA